MNIEAAMLSLIKKRNSKRQIINFIFAVETLLREATITDEKSVYVFAYASEDTIYEVDDIPGSRFGPKVTYD